MAVTTKKTVSIHDLQKVNAQILGDLEEVARILDAVTAELFGVEPREVSPTPDEAEASGGVIRTLSAQQWRIRSAVEALEGRARRLASEIVQEKSGAVEYPPETMSLRQGHTDAAGRVEYDDGRSHRLGYPDTGRLG